MVLLEMMNPPDPAGERRAKHRKSPRKEKRQDRREKITDDQIGAGERSEQSDDRVRKENDFFTKLLFFPHFPLLFLRDLI